MMVAGRPLCWPSSPDGEQCAAAASSASWLRCRRCGCRPGRPPATVPRRRRASSTGLHMPGAASLANTASRVARASGVRWPLIAHAVEVLLAEDQAASCGAVVVGEVAVGVEAVGELVGELGQLVGAVLGGQPGQLASARARVSTSTNSGSRCQKPRITATCPAPDLAVALRGSGASNTGDNGSPVNARRSPRSSASCTRREASSG